MGLFDYVRCKHALPGIENPESILFQTKDFDDPYMLTYEITLDGRLMRELIHYEDKSDPAAEKGSIESFGSYILESPGEVK